MATLQLENLNEQIADYMVLKNDTTHLNRTVLIRNPATNTKYMIDQFENYVAKKELVKEKTIELVLESRKSVGQKELEEMTAKIQRDQELAKKEQIINKVIQERKEGGP